LAAGERALPRPMRSPREVREKGGLTEGERWPQAWTPPLPPKIKDRSPPLRWIYELNNVEQQQHSCWSAAAARHRNPWSRCSSSSTGAWRRDQRNQRAGLISICARHERPHTRTHATPRQPCNLRPHGTLQHGLTDRPTDVNPIARMFRPPTLMDAQCATK